ncbi:MAG: hypothetical protein IT456_01480 [Planctomycetes bacterium]|nr:hypothetical protein [Planctomycetota bacterium]
MKESATFALRALAMIAACTAAAAQCANQYVPNMQLAGVDGIVRAVTVWDRDGTGPLPPLAVLGGSFAQAGTTSVASIVAFDPATGVWSSLGLGVSAFGSPGEVLALATAANGDLLVGGSFTMAGGVNGILNIARWGGVNWSALGGGTSAPMRAIEAMAEHDSRWKGGWAVATSIHWAVLGS